MTFARAAWFMVLSVAICGAGGSAIGVGIGVLWPAYYRSVFAGGQHPNFDPVAVGFGQGITQGVVAGIVIGCVIVLAVTWAEVKRQQQT